MEALDGEPDQEHLVDARDRHDAPGRRRRPAASGTATSRPAPAGPSAPSGTVPSSTSPSGVPGRVDRRAVDLDDPRFRGVGRHPPVVHDPQRVVVGPPAVAAHPRLVGGVHAGLLAHHRLEPGLLEDLADDGVPRVLAVVDAAAGQRPLLVAGDPGRQPRQQDALVAHDDGVRRHSLSPGQGHGLQSRPRPRADRTGRAGASRLYGSRDDPTAPARDLVEGEAPRPVARQRQDGAGHHRGGRAHGRAGAGRRRAVAHLRLHLLLPHPRVRAGHGVPLEVVPLQQAAPVGAAHHHGDPVRRLLLADDPLALRARRARAAGVVPEPALADVVPRRHGDVAAADPAAAGPPRHGAGVGRGEPAGGPGQQRARSTSTGCSGSCRSS